MTRQKLQTTVIVTVSIEEKKYKAIHLKLKALSKQKNNTPRSSLRAREAIQGKID